MSFNFLDQGFMPGASYSRELDRRVSMDEYPYGYDGDTPPAGYANQGIVDQAYKNTPLKPQGKPWSGKNWEHRNE